jgi:hypothetical protein
MTKNLQKMNKDELTRVKLHAQHVLSNLDTL